MEVKRMLVMFAPKAQQKKKGSELGRLHKDDKPVAENPEPEAQSETPS